MKVRVPKKYGDKMLNRMEAPDGSKMSFTMKFGDEPANDTTIDGEAVDVTVLDEAGGQ